MPLNSWGRGNLLVEGKIPANGSRVCASAALCDGLVIKRVAELLVAKDTLASGVALISYEQTASLG